MPLWGSKKRDVESSEITLVEARFTADQERFLQELVEYAYMSGWNYAWSIKGVEGKPIKRPSGRVQFRRWCSKMRDLPMYAKFKNLFTPSNFEIGSLKHFEDDKD